MDSMAWRSYSILHCAARHGRLNCMRLLERAGADLNASRSTRMRQSPLQIGCKLGHADIVRFLLEKGVHLDPETNKEDSPLLLACSRGHVECARLLIAAGADVEGKMSDICGNGLRPI